MRQTFIDIHWYHTPSDQHYEPDYLPVCCTIICSSFERLTWCLLYQSIYPGGSCFFIWQKETGTACLNSHLDRLQLHRQMQTNVHIQACTHTHTQCTVMFSSDMVAALIATQTVPSGRLTFRWWADVVYGLCCALAWTLSTLQMIYYRNTESKKKKITWFKREIKQLHATNELMISCNILCRNVTPSSTWSKFTVWSWSANHLSSFMGHQSCMCLTAFLSYLMI